MGRELELQVLGHAAWLVDLLKVHAMHEARHAVLMTDCAASCVNTVGTCKAVCMMSAKYISSPAVVSGTCLAMSRCSVTVTSQACCVERDVLRVLGTHGILSPVACGRLGAAYIA